MQEPDMNRFLVGLAVLRFHVASLGQVPSQGRNGDHHSHPKIPAQNVVLDRESKGGTKHDRYLNARSQR